MHSHAPGVQHTAEPKNTHDTAGSKINFRLIAEYSTRLQAAAQAAKVSPNQMARTLLVSALETPRREELLSDLNKLATTTEFLREDLTELRRDMTLLTHAVSAILELFLASSLDLSEPEIEALLGELFADGGETP